MRHLTLILLAMFSFHASAEVFKVDANGNYVFTKTEFKSSELLYEYAKQKSLNMNVTKDFTDETFTIQGNMVIPKDKIDGYVSSVLSRGGYLIVRLRDPMQINVISSRDLRYTTLPVYTNISDVPETDEGIQYNYTSKYYDSNEVSNILRPFLSREGRVVSMRSSNTIHISETGKNVRRLAKIIQALDKEETLKSKKEVDELNEKNKKLITKDKGYLDTFVKNSGLLMIVFMLIGLIIGFGSRGYMMKKVEGGW